MCEHYTKTISDHSQGTAQRQLKTNSIKIHLKNNKKQPTASPERRPVNGRPALGKITLPRPPRRGTNLWALPPPKDNIPMKNVTPLKTNSAHN